VEPALEGVDDRVDLGEGDVCCDVDVEGGLGLAEGRAGQ
jgi:hypothetical protein